jgi:hypothetical protein
MAVQILTYTGSWEPAAVLRSVSRCHHVTFEGIAGEVGCRGRSNGSALCASSPATVSAGWHPRADTARAFLPCLAHSAGSGLHLLRRQCLQGKPAAGNACSALASWSPAAAGGNWLVNRQGPGACTFHLCTMQAEAAQTSRAQAAWILIPDAQRCARASGVATQNASHAPATKQNVSLNVRRGLRAVSAADKLSKLSELSRHERHVPSMARVARRLGQGPYCSSRRTWTAAEAGPVLCTAA